MKETPIDSGGRLVVPKEFRNQLHLRTGDLVQMEVQGDILTIRPARPKARLERINGVLVFSSGMTMPDRDWVGTSREARLEDLRRNCMRS
jgi:AbrB family looped-hinge helix DNA binding protein